MKEQRIAFRKRATLWVLLLMIKIIEPTEYGHAYDDELKKLKELIKEI